jgi:hypothetical protein
VPEKLVKWPKKPRIIQFNAGRIEFSIPNQLGVAVLLGLGLLLLVVFRLGQFAAVDASETSEIAAEPPKTMENVTEHVTFKEPQVPQPVRVSQTVPAAAVAEEVEQYESTGSNRIVIQTYQTRTQLEPVTQFFATNGIATQIREIGGMYYLVTSRKYHNPERKGTDGHYAKQQIIELGANYKAPPGYETFGRRPFHDAYGMRFDD